jgi:hypothetical protein
MRFSEFKILTEAGAGKIVVVGDSIAVGIGQSIKGSTVNATVGINSSKILSNVTSDASLKDAKLAIISAGSNDIVKGKGNPQTLATNLAAIKTALGAEKYVWILPYDPVASKTVAQAAGSDKTVDLKSFPTNDGLHPGNYSAVANAARAGLNLTSNTPGNVPTKDKGQAAQPGGFSLDVPNSRRGPAVADVQKTLIALGYPLPKHGVDGIRGPETVAAVKQFQQANNLTVDGDPGKETVAKLNAALAAKPEITAKLTKSTPADVKSKPADNSARAAAAGAIEINDENTAAAKTSAEKFLGRSIDDNEWNYLIRAVVSEASPNTKEQAYVMGVILNRARSGKWGNSIVSVLNAKNQFQAVTGTRYDPGPSANFTRGPNKNQLASILKGAIEILPQVDKSLMNFTAASTAAYGPGTNLGFRDTLLAKGGQQIGGTIFA